MHIRDLTGFLSELSENNQRAWFVMNRPRYDILRAEFLQLVTELIAGIARFDPAVAGCDPKKALFRINRDIRFSADKSPYKTTFSAAFTTNGLKKPSQGGGPMYYFHIDARSRLMIAAGEYLPPADRLRRIRQHLLADAKGFAKVLADKKLRAAYGDLRQQDKLSRPPKGFAADTAHAEYLRLKSFIVSRELALESMLPEQLTAHLLAGFRDAWPLVAWLRTAQ